MIELPGWIASYFSVDELSCNCGECELPVSDPEFLSFMEIAVEMRRELGFPFIVNSAYRCPAYNATVSSTGEDGPHTKMALDLRVSFERAYDLAALAFSTGLGVGIKQSGPVKNRFIHIDNQGRRLWDYP